MIWSTPASKSVIRSRGEALGARKPNSALICEQFADGPNTAAAEMIDVVGHPLAFTQFDQIFHRGDEVLLHQDALFFANLEPKLLVDLVTPAEIVTLGSKKSRFSMLRAFWTVGGSPGRSLR